MYEASSNLIIRGPEPLLAVGDIERSVKFYCEPLGFKLIESYRPEDKLCWCRVARGGSALMLEQGSNGDASSSKRGHGVHFYFLCLDADAIYRELQAVLGVKPPKVAFYGMNQLFVTDPDGYELCFQNIVS